MINRKFCAHRGVSALMPENTLPAFAAALSLGADEIEFDVRLTKDNQLVVSHDSNLARVCDGHGDVSDYTLDELKTFNIGINRGWQVTFCTPREVFSQFANKMIFNIHLKHHGKVEFIIYELLKLVEEYNAFDTVYFAGSPSELEWMERIAPNMKRVAIQLPSDNIEIYEIAKKYNCSGVQFWLDMFDKELIDKLHNEGIWCNLYYADNSVDFIKYYEMGIDTILTNRMDLASEYRRQNNL